MQTNSTFILLIQFLTCFNIVYCAIGLIQWARGQSDETSRGTLVLFTDLILFFIIVRVFLSPVSDLTMISRTNLICMIFAYGFNAVIKSFLALTSILLTVLRANLNFIAEKINKPVPEYINKYPAQWNALIESSQAIVVIATTFRFYEALKMI